MQAKDASRSLARNTWSFGLGTLGRDMTAALVSMYLIFYLTDVIGVSDSALTVITITIFALRIFDACNDPVMGMIVDNTSTRWGKFKPWIALGALLWGATTVILFVDFGLSGAGFLVLFAVLYLLWGVTYTINDISYWGMLPSLSRSQRERESIGVVARIAANIGLFAVVVAIIPVTAALENHFGSAKTAWFAFAVIVVAIMLAFQAITLLFTTEQVATTPSHTRLRELLGVIARNDQLLWAGLSMLTFMIGYATTSTLGIYYFKYIVGNEGLYSILTAILGVAQLGGLALFPMISKRFARQQIFTLGISLCLAGLVVFALAGSSMIVIGLAGVLLFGGQAFIQLLLLMFVADSVEYGQWKLGRRNESVTVAIQPFIYKASNAIGTGLVGLALIWSGINGAGSAADVSESGRLVFKAMMFGVPLVLIALSWLIMRSRYKLDEATFRDIVTELETKGA